MRPGFHNPLASPTLFLFLLGLCLLILSVPVLAVPERADPETDTMLFTGKVASIDLCADLLAARLLERERIIGLSPQIRDRRLSPLADADPAFPVLPPSTESLLLSGADVILTGEYGDIYTLGLLKRLGIPTLTIPSKNDFPAILTTITETGTALAVPEQAEALVSEINTRLTAIVPPTPASRPVALYLRPDGGTAAAGTFVDAALSAAGYANFATLSGKHGWSSFDLEMLVMAPPDRVVTSFFNTSFGTTMHRFGEHRLLKKLLAPLPVVDIPSQWLVCGGWPLVEAVEKLATSRSPSLPSLSPIPLPQETTP